MNVLIVGGGKGSWEMRGLQLGAALGARVSTAPTAEDIRWADLVVLVKRAATQWSHQVRAANKPIVWDALDFWSQPAHNGLSEAEAVALLNRQIAQIQPALVIGATESMARACGGVYLPHHPWSGLAPTPARPQVRTVGYDGNILYLGAWRQRLDDACARRGWTFVVEPPDLTDVDVLVSFRAGVWDGWICRAWKSGVKLVNAIAAGRPIIAQPSAAWQELRPHGTTAETVTELEAALDFWAPYDRRAGVATLSEAAATRLTVSVIANQYRAALASVTKVPA